MKTLEEQVEELNGQKLVEQEQSITVYKGEIIVPLRGYTPFEVLHHIIHFLYPLLSASVS